MVSKGVSSVKLSLNRFLFSIVLCSIFSVPLPSAIAEPQFYQLIAAEPKTDLTIENKQVKCVVEVQGKKLLSDRLDVQSSWAALTGGTRASVVTDADFAIDLMYTDWDAPGKANCADNLVTFTKNNFSYQRQEIRESADGTKELALYFAGVDHVIQLMVTYRLEPSWFYVKRNIAVCDTAGHGHFVRFFMPRSGEITGVTKVVKDGGFGQPIAVTLKSGGAFFGSEYPAADNKLVSKGKGTCTIRCSSEYGDRIPRTWINSDWVVEGVTPDPYVKLWFDKYVNDIRVAPLRSYSLYNSWYDLRSPEYPRWPKENVMSEQTGFKMANILRRNMIEKHNIQLDAFVLDDGWDVYKSDWVLRKEQWPNGLKPLSDELKKTNTSLGMWIGPTGGYSFRRQRLDFMREQGYEIVNDMLCVGGKKYSSLLKERIADFVENNGVGYFKWDGIQFTCSEPNHGHPVDVYSRRAILRSVEEMCKVARDRNPNMFLNITSGTWMSPWWVKYANTIWMQGADYGFADVPSITMRDGAITYRDFVLYEDWNIKGLWFPIANLMTHGIIKGKSESVGANAEPLDKFTDDVLLYFARGVAMYELYISPDILSDGEWTSISRSMAWARKNFDLLMHTELIGGNPLKGQAYGYVHFNGKRGIIAARNPVIETATLTVGLEAALGLDPKAGSLVLQRLYPTRWTSPRLYKTGDVVTLPLDGFEMAVYELFPLSDSSEPLLADVVYSVAGQSGKSWKLSLYSPSKDVKILNPAVLSSSAETSKELQKLTAELEKVKVNELVTGKSVVAENDEKNGLEVHLTVGENAIECMVALLLAQDNSVEKKIGIKVTAQIDGQDAKISTERQEGKSQWYKVAITGGKHAVKFQVVPAKDSLVWSGKATAWFVSRQRQNSKEIEFTLNQPAAERLLPPTVWPAGEVRKSIKLGEATLIAKGAKH
jgi:hypothetical protein